MSTDEQPFLYTKDASRRVATMTFNRPEARNALNGATLSAFSEALADFRDDNDMWVAIITGSGEKAFSAGADLKEVNSGSVGEGGMAPHIMRGMDIWKPIIAAINGQALGGGLEVVLACDLRVAADTAKLGLPEGRWAVMPGWGGTQRLPREVSRTKAAEMLFFGTPITAAEALDIGLVNLVVPQDKVMAVADEWADRLCENGPLALRAMKQAMIRGTEVSLEEGLQLEQQLLMGLFTSEDAIEGVRSFVERRKAEFKAK